MAESPVLVIGWNRPVFLKQVLSTVIRNSQNRQVYVSLDGSRKDDAGWQECIRLVEEAQKSFPIVFRIHPENLGPRNGPVAAISWFFETELQGIILEDDCSPHPEFFPFCDILLARYMMNPSVGAISGFRCAPDDLRNEITHSFARSIGIWGWATWRDRWQRYDVNMSRWTTLTRRERRSLRASKVAGSRKYWWSTFEDVTNGVIPTWDYQWIFACWLAHSRTCIPNVNLVENLDLNRHLLDYSLWPENSMWRELLVSRSGQRGSVKQVSLVDESQYLDSWSDRHLREVGRFNLPSRLAALVRGKGRLNKLLGLFLRNADTIRPSGSHRQ